MKKLLVLFVCLVFLSSGNCLECYVCQSVPHTAIKCHDPFDKSTHVPENCVNQKDVCLKTKLYSLENVPDNVHRGCVDPEYCKGKEHVYCTTCETDHCNLALNLSPSPFAIVLYLSTYFTVKRFL